MIDKLMDWFFEKVFLRLIIFFIFSLFILIPFACVMNSKENEKNMAECMKDHKEYECVAMLKSCNRGSSTIIPIMVK